jgi:hypothetical protein
VDVSLGSSKFLTHTRGVSADNRQLGPPQLHGDEYGRCVIHAMQCFGRSWLMAQASSIILGRSQLLL